jgi:hypothetical protein
MTVLRIPESLNAREDVVVLPIVARICQEPINVARDCARPVVPRARTAANPDSGQ